VLTITTLSNFNRDQVSGKLKHVLAQFPHVNITQFTKIRSSDSIISWCWSHMRWRRERALTLDFLRMHGIVQHQVNQIGNLSFRVLIIKRTVFPWQSGATHYSQRGGIARLQKCKYYADEAYDSTTCIYCITKSTPHYNLFHWFCECDNFPNHVTNFKTKFMFASNDYVLQIYKVETCLIVFLQKIQ
jgi:hypothetical protein